MLDGFAVARLRRAAVSKISAAKQTRRTKKTRRYILGSGLFDLQLSRWFTPSTDKLKIFLFNLSVIGYRNFLYGKCFGIKCSGHASGLCGPIAFLGCFVNVWILFAEILIIPLIWASTNIKRHSIAEMALGALVRLFLWRYRLLYSAFYRT